MKNLSCIAKLSLLVFLIWTTSVSAQEVETVTINNKTYYVYPNNQEITENKNYSNAVIHRKIKLDYNDYKAELTEKEFKSLLKQRNKNRNSGQKSTYLSWFNARQLNKLIFKIPMPFLEPKYTFSKDIIPPLDSLPDGNYVQYFDDYYPNNRFGKLAKHPEKRVAGYFSIKNNALDGNACWFNLQGDTLKQGVYVNGLKEGNWKIEKRNLPYTFYYSDFSFFKKNGFPHIDTITEFYSFKNGAKEGYYRYFSNSEIPLEEGFYKSNLPTGKWIKRTIKSPVKKYNKTSVKPKIILEKTYQIAEEKISVKQPIIRYNAVLNQDPTDSNFNFNSNYSNDFSILKKMFSINFPKENALNLEEEEVNSYEGTDYSIVETRPEFGYISKADEEVNYSNKGYFKQTNESLTLSKLIDSLGIQFYYDGDYEEYYPNGQLKFKYTFLNGNLVEEDTLFWDNGNPFDVITFSPDSNHYIRQIFDYEKKLFREMIYNEKGEFLRFSFYPEYPVKKLLIDGFEVEDNDYGDYYFYDKKDTLSSKLADKVILFQSWTKANKKPAYNQIYEPNKRELNVNIFGITGDTCTKSIVQFGDDFNSWNGQKNFYFQDLCLHQDISASFMPVPFPEDEQWYLSEEETWNDSLNPEMKVKEFEDLFEQNVDATLLNNNTPYSGKFTMHFSKLNFKLTTKNNISLTIPTSYRTDAIVHKAIKKYDSKGLIKEPILMRIFDYSEIQDINLGEYFFENLLTEFVKEYAHFPDNYNYNNYSRKLFNVNKSKITGYFENGKPTGIWRVINKKGNLITEIPFENGLIHGTIKNYSWAYPDKWAYSELYESSPNKKTKYLESSYSFQNGIENGPWIDYDWNGAIIKYETYKDGYLEGPAYERNLLAHTDLNFHYGKLDGYVRTYLTIKGKDSMLLYSLNFQNGMLQGESKSYHTTGKLAKRGFFLNGESIDDYEAFDTLGFKYHYVKFQYGYPIEEKIWEENKLSVRYLFDWRDSIYFVPSDITETQSLERVLSDLNIGRDNYREPYYGRPSLVQKTGIDYHLTKYFPNDTIARDGQISNGKKVGCWKYYSYDGEFLYEVDYYDTIIAINDSIKFKVKGLMTDYDPKGNKLSESYVIEKFEKYDCAHTDHYEIRQYYTIWETSDSIKRMNGYVKNYYDNGVIQNEGWMKDGLPSGVWKYYDPYGKLNLVGNFVMGKRDGRWLSGDLSKTKYLGDICLNPNLPNLEEEIKKREKELEITIINYSLGKALNKEFYDLDLNEKDVLYEEVFMDNYDYGDF